MTGKELFEADMNRYNALKGRSWETTLTDGYRRCYNAWAVEASAMDCSTAQALDLIVDPDRHKAWIKHEFPPWKEGE